jgi:pyruvate/2-oxoglutarate/acetoin dehydrogenase E1 component
VIDPIWLSPLDVETIAASAARTGRLLVVDNGWSTCGASAEILSAVYERLQGAGLPRARRMAFAPTPCPTTPSLEQLFYPNARTIAAAAYDLAKGAPQGWLPRERPELKDIEFKGPF